jgi:predicted amidophosphoribosyltransferase
MAAEIARQLDAPLARGVLSRARPTFTQTNLSRSERWKNVSNAFAADASLIASGALGNCCRVVLVDDVVTTGATAVAAALTLRAAGVREVTVVAAGLARA